MEELGRREGYVIGADTQDSDRIIPAAADPVIVQVYRCLRAPGAARSPQPERDVLRPRRCGIQFGRILGKPLIPIHLPRPTFADDNDMAEEMLRT